MSADKSVNYTNRGAYPLRTEMVFNTIRRGPNSLIRERYLTSLQNY